MTQEDLNTLQDAWVKRADQEPRSLYRMFNQAFEIGWFSALDWERSRVKEIASRPPEETL